MSENCTSLSARSWQYRDRMMTEVGTMAYSFRMTLTKANLDIIKWLLDVASVADGGPTSNQHCVNISYLFGILSEVSDKHFD